MNRRRFKRSVKEALTDENMRTALCRATEVFRVRRELTSQVINMDGLRSEVRAIKARSIEAMPELVARFATEAEAVGAKVYQARDAKDANGYIAELAERHNVTLAAKSKSMVTEEIGLNTYLELKGVKVVETDLGEWIVQLANERPSHMLVPAVHKTREQVAKLFAEATGEDVSSENIGSLVTVARRALRQSFVDAGLGISGANVAIANSGSLVIVSNEGNARLVTTLPPVHVAVIGVEKIVATMSDATKILEILPPSATGQKMSSYVSFITGPSRTSDIEMSLTMGAHGPRELHIVLLDNGRDQMREDPVFHEALYCLKCAACLNVCPVYQTIGGHVYGHTYVGGIGTVLTAFLVSLKEAANAATLCLQCGACEAVCPSRIGIPRLIRSLRDRLAESGNLSYLEQLLYGRILPNGKTLNRLHVVGKALQAPLSRQGIIHGIPFSKMVPARSLPILAAKPLRSCIDRSAIKKPNATKTLFYGGCLIEHAYPEIGEAVVHVLAKMDVSVALPQEQPCCGVPARYAGDRRAAVVTAKLNLELLEKEEFEHLVVACPTCGEAFTHEYPALLADEPEWQVRALAVADKTVEFTQFVVKWLGEEGLRSLLEVRGEESLEARKGSAKTKITYHDSCHLKRYLGVTAEPRTILKTFTDCEFVELADACCGMGGTFCAKFPEVSGRILSRRLDEVGATGAKILTTACPGCLMQMRGGIDKRRLPVRVQHVAEVMAERLCSCDYLPIAPELPGSV